LFHLVSPASYFQAAYEMALNQLDWQLAAEARTAQELAGLRARLEALEASLNDRQAQG
jgi:BMFP domain-containing protein YqiC